MINKINVKAKSSAVPQLLVENVSSLIFNKKSILSVILASLETKNNNLILNRLQHKANLQGYKEHSQSYILVQYLHQGEIITYKATTITNDNTRTCIQLLSVHIS